MRTDNRTKTVRLTFKRSELVYDCENYSFVEGDLMKEDEEHAKHQVFDIAQDGNVDRVTRMFNLCFADCVELCYPYSKESVEDGAEMDDTLVYHETYVLTLRLPESFSQTTVKLLLKLIHELMVDYVMADWMSITKPSSKTNWEEKIEKLKERITSCMSMRMGRVRRPMTPF